MAVRVSRDMLTLLLDKLKTYFPISLEIHGAIQFIAERETDESEIWVDSWPDIQAVLLHASNEYPAVALLGNVHEVFATNVQSARNVLGYRRPLDGGNGFFFPAVRELLWGVIEEIATSSNLNTEGVSLAILLYLPDTTPLPECTAVPDGYKLDILLPSHGAKVSREWFYYSGLKTELYVKDLIQNFPSIGVYEQISGDLVAWMICYENGAMGQLFVIPDHRRKGLGTLCLVALARSVRKQGKVPYLFIFPENSVSLEFHRKHGFVDVEEKFKWINCSKNVDI